MTEATLRPDIHAVPDYVAPPSLLDQVEVLGTREGGLIEVMVSPELIFREDVPVDEDHVQELSESMQSEAADNESTGQLSPILLAEVPGEEKFLLVDGFHRDAAMYGLGREKVFATIRPNSTLEDVLDLRIITATMHSSVTFARTVEWITDAWQRTPWANKISVNQAFALNNTKSSGKLLGLHTADADSIKDWVQQKSAKWHMSPVTIKVNLATAEAADPELVKEARRRVGGHELTDITPMHLGVIAPAFPGRYPEQRLVAKIAKDNNFNVQHTRAVVEMLKPARNVEEARAIAGAVDWSHVQPKHSRSRERELRKVTESTNEAVPYIMLRDFLQAELQIGVLSVQNLVLAGNYVVPNHGEQKSQPSLRVDVSDSPDFDKFVRGFDAVPRIDTFLDRVDQVQAGMVRQITQAGQSEQDARILVNIVAELVTHDMEYGALRYMFDLNPRQHDQLMVNGIKQELSLLRPVDNATDGKCGPSANPADISLESVLQAYPRMKDTLRRYLTFSGFMGLSNFAIKQLMQIDREKATSYSGQLRNRLIS